MGESEGWAEQQRLLPNGLLPGAGHVLRVLDSERWARAEERTAELISCIQPNQLSEERRNAVAEYVQQLIMKCFPCQVCTFGSVPLKTYLPDGDIDLAAFSQDQNLKENWANQVRDMLQNEEKNENAEFHVKEVQYIQAEVKLIKCLVENIVVDISFNQVGGLCTLCFLDEVDNLIKENHLFKRSIILIKAWCYYESRILGAHHGLISTYALETLVLYIFHLFNNSFHGPLEVLYRFLEFFSLFDWDNFCLSLWGPVPISSLPDVTAESPRKDTGELLLTKAFLEACSYVYAVFPGGQDNNGQPFVSKHFNVIDPLRVNNNLGRSVSKGNFFRIRSAFAFGAKRLARLLNCPEENLSFEVNQFFMNTWERHGSGHRPDAPGVVALRMRLSNPDGLHEFGDSSNNSTGNNVNQNQNPSVHGVSSQHGKKSASHPKSLKSQKPNSSRVSDRARREHPSDWVLVNDEVQNANHPVVNDIHSHFFARTSSSPELTDPYGSDFSSHSRHNRKLETLNTPIPSKQSLDVGKDSHVDASGEEFSSASGPMHQEEQDIVNMMASSSLQGLNGQFHVPFNLNPAQLPFSIPPSFLASMGYTQRKFVPTNFPLMDPSFSNLQFPSNLVSPHLTHYFPGVGVNSTIEASFEQGKDNLGSEELDNDYWQEHEIENDKPSASISGLKYIPPHRLSSSDSAKGVQLKNIREKHGLSKKNSDGFLTQDVGKSESYAEERSVSSRFSTRSNSLRSRASSESSWDGSSAKTPKFTKEKRGKKIISSADYGKGKIMSKHMPNQPENNDNVEIFERNSKPDSVASVPIHAHSLSGLEAAQPSGSDSIMSFAPMLIGPGSRQRMNDNSGLVAFYPTGPPIPFLTMLPVYNVPPEAGASNETLENSDSVQNFSPEGYGHSEDYYPSNSLRLTSTTKDSENKNSDILTSDFASHWHNLQFGRLCQNPRNGPLLYPSPVMVPPRYLQGVRSPYDNPGRPFSTNVNSSPQLMTSYGQRMVPVAPTQTVSSKPNIYQSYMDDVPRYPGTGTYHPNHSIRERLPSGTRRGSYNTYDKNDSYGDKDGHWNMNQKSRPVRGHSRNNQSDKSNPRSWNNSHRNESIPSYQSQNHNGPQNMAYNMYPLAATNPNGVSNGLPSQPLMMIYPYDHTMYGEQLEFGSLGPVVDTPGVDEQLQLNDGTQGRVFQDHRLHGGSEHHSSPDQPSSPHYQSVNRRV